MFRQSFQPVIVTNNPTLLAVGTTTDLAVEQIGIFDAKTNQAITLPTYSVNREIYFAQGTPDFSAFPAGAGKLNETLKSKPIKGTKLTGWRGKKAKRGQTSLVAIGFDGLDTSKTLTAKPGEVKNFFIKLTGSPIEKLVPGAGGIVRHIQISMPCVDDCETNCDTVDCNVIVERFIAAFNRETLPGGIFLNKFIKASKLVDCTTPATIDTVAYTNYCLSVADAGDQHSLGAVQAQYPGLVITRTERNGILSTYQFTQPTADAAPAAFTNEDLTLIPNCATCPSGYTYEAVRYAFTVTRTDAGNAAALTTARTDYGADSFRLNYEFGTSTYQVYASTDTLAAVTAGDVVTFVGEVRDVCVLSSPTTTAWVTCGTGVRAETTYTITLRDDVCGNSWLTELQALYGTVTEVANNPDTCTRQYEVTVVSDNLDVDGDCVAEDFLFTAPQPFNGVKWVKTPLAVGTTCSCGILLETAFVNRTLTECYYDAFPYEMDNIHIEVATGNPDYNDFKDLCDNDLPVTVLREFEYPSGSGQYIAKLEEMSRKYDLEGRPVDQFVRNARQWAFNTDLTKFYDQYVLEFEFSYPVGGFTEYYTDKYHLNIFVPEGTGAALEAALNGYVSSAKIDLPLVVL